MKAHLLYRDMDFSLKEPLPHNAEQLEHDLDLETLYLSMAAGDGRVHDVCRAALMNGLSDYEAIEYRQHVLSDCLANHDTIRAIYALTGDALQEERKFFWLTTRNSPSGMMSQSPRVIGMYVEYLKRLRALVDEHSGEFVSEGWSTLFAVLKRDLSDDYFALIDKHLKLLKFKDGTLISAGLSFGNSGTNYVLRDPSNAKQTIRELLHVGGRKSYSFEIPPRDEAGAKALSDLMGRGVNSAANSLTQAADHLASFFVMLRTELAFYIGCLNLSDSLSLKGEPTCVPVARSWSPARLSFSGLYDVCLSLRNTQRVVGNDVVADDKTLTIITGANSGGKSTFLRSVGVAQLMMRAGMFVAAQSLEASTCNQIFTHFVREEDSSMKSGKLDEELSRMSTIADEVTPGSMVLFNESFSATNEREGSEIARQVLQALLESDVRVFVVTHLFELAQYFYLHSELSTSFLRAGRETDSARTYKLHEGPPLATSYALDVFDRIGGW
jgi:DNA mismatch repair ATPase MutS